MLLLLLVMVANRYASPTAGGGRRLYIGFTCLIAKNQRRECPKAFADFSLHV
jgi:hypothetical protein